MDEELDEELKDEGKKVSLPFFGIPKLMPFLKPYVKPFILCVICGIIGSAIDVIYPLFNRYAIDNFIGRGDLTGLPAFIILYLLVMVIQLITDYFAVTKEIASNINVSTDLRRASFNHLQTLSFSYFNQNNVGYIQARVTSDTARIGDIVFDGAMQLVWNGTYMIGVFAVMFSINAKLAAMILILIPIGVLVTIFFEKKLTFLNRKVREKNSQITGDYNEGITGARALKTLVVEDKLYDEFKGDTEKMRRLSVRTTKYSAFFWSFMGFVSSLTLALVLWQGGILTRDNFMMIGTLSVFMSYASGILDPVQTIVNTISNLIQAEVNIERLTNLINTESDVADSPEVIEKYGDMFHPKKENWEPLIGDIEFKDVSFKYPDGDEMVLEHFNLKVPQGTNVAIVGETGAGKSTLVNLVCRFFEPTSGQVLIDGRDARERSQGWLHGNLGYVLQTPHLFSGTVRENLRYGKPDATDEEIMEAVRTVDAESVIEKMGNGLDSEVGEGGDLLSTGEKQLLSFARAILADPRILVLDEATSSIDTVTEKRIQSAIGKVIKGRTSFMIAHRLSTVVDADVILVVKDGKIIERGTHKELMAEKGYYYELFSRQFDTVQTQQII